MQSVAFLITVKPVYSDHPRETKNVAFIDRWLLYAGSYTDNVPPWESILVFTIGRWLL